MKITTKITILFFILAIALTSCDMLGDLFGNKEPVTTTDTIQNKDGSVTEITKTEYDNGNVITDEKTTFKDNSISVKHTEYDGDTEVTTSKETITYSDSNTSGKKSDVIETKEGHEDNKGFCKYVTTTSDFKDGHKEIASSEFNGLTQYTKTSLERINVDKSSKKEISSSIDNGGNSGYTLTHAVEEKDSNEKFIKTVNIIAQTPEGTQNSIVYKKTTTKDYSNGELTTTTDETHYPCLGEINDGLYILEVKNKSGQTIIKEREYKFVESIKGTIIIFNDITSEARILNNTLPEGDYFHGAFITTKDEYRTQIKINNTTIVLNDVAQSIKKVYQVNNTLSLSFLSKF